MLVYCGIDEAGYGPLLGPLCVAATVIEIDSIDGAAEDVRPPDLWTALRSAVSASPSQKDRIAIADSKRLKGAKEGKAHPLRHLERGVLGARLAAGEALPADDGELFAGIGVDAIAPVARSPWYEHPVPLPLAASAESLAIAGNRLRVAARSAGLRFGAIECLAVDGAEFNRRVATCPKSDLNFGLAMRLVDRLWTSHAARHPRVAIDRQGGRAHYREHLAESFPGAKIRILGESDAVSRYRLEDHRGPITLSFEVECESRHLPAALASMTAKFVRELHMERLNRYFRSLLPDVKPTAGYVEDGRRFLGEVRPTLRRLGIPEAHLVRSR